MTDFSIELAGVPIRVSAIFDTTKRFCDDYLTDRTPQVSVAIAPGDLAAERERSKRQRLHDANVPRNPSDAYLETLALYRKIAQELLAYDTIVFHGSVLALDGRAYLFTAPSGTGKTTHTRFWLQMIAGSYVLNGDKPLLRVSDGQVLACGTPWRGKEHLGCNETLPLAALCILERDSYDHIEPMSLHDGLGTLIQQTNRPDDVALMPHTIELVGRLGAAVPLFRMGCTLDERSALVSHAAMTDAMGGAHER